MSGYSDLIRELTYTTPLTAGSSWTSEKIIAGQYSSITVSFASDQQTRITTQWSNDGKNWDINIGKIFDAGTGYENLVILGKWMRFYIQNISIIDQTYLRVYTYGSTTNNAINALIQKVGNISPEISVDNLPLSAFGELMTTEDYSQIEYLFTNGVSGDIATDTWELPYNDIKAYTDITTSLLFSSGVMTVAASNLAVGEIIIVWGAPYRYHPGIGMECRFTCRHLQTAASVKATQFMGLGNVHNNRIVDGYGFGYSPTSSEYGIHYYYNGTSTFYPQSQWNVDPCDGSVIMPIINPEYPQVYEIAFQYLGFGQVFFYIENPNTGLPQLVHKVNRVNQSSLTANLLNPSLGMCIFGLIPPEIVEIPTISIKTASFAIRSQGKPAAPNERVAMEHTKTGVSTEANVLTVRCDPTFYTNPNYWGIDVDQLSVAVDGTKNTTIRLYRNSTLTTPSYTTPYQYIMPVSYDTAGSFTTPGTYLLSFQLDKTGKQLINLNEYHIHLNPGDILTFTAQSSASTDVSISVSAHLH